MIFVIWFGVLVVTVIFYLREVYSRFSRHGVRHFKPFPLLGNNIGLILRNSHVSTDFQRLFVGRYEILNPITVIRDLELIKKVTLKDVESFLDRRNIVDESVDTLFGRGLFSLKASCCETVVVPVNASSLSSPGQEWKDMRSTLSPAFTSSKMRAMVPFMVDVNKQMINMVMKKIEASGTTSIDLECKDLTTRYANDVIASCAFGVKVDSHTDEENEFYVMGRNTANFGLKRILTYFGYCASPAIMKKLNIKLFEDDIKNFFKSLVMSNMKEREDRAILRPDMIHLLMEAKKGALKHDTTDTKDADAGFSTVEESDIGKMTVNRTWSDEDLVSQAFLFFLAGFETVSSTMSFLLHELAVNPDVQERLVQEIRENDEKSGGKFDYSSIQNMTYMDMVVSEVLRLWPPVSGLGRICLKDYNLGKPYEKAQSDFIVRKGESVVIPVWAIHRDPAYFPDPERFDPERFSEQNKHIIKPFTYMPFGSGPRNCIGSRFALCEVKVMLYQLLQRLEVSPCARTCIPAKLSTATFTLNIEGGHWIRLTARKG
ncbi:Microsomal cytochrome P450 [Operophtera brumata]|uniref:unspecific monooxygenase n=1 Tax=Operophtera brumata TaxID=104452 RepID=A0A0L7L0K4_OPEBR|nr:Microsomal cytochrome P450 [Operophtera brumata]